MRKLFLTAGAATLALAVSATAAPGDRGGRGGNQERVQRSNDRQAARQQVRTQRAERTQQRAERPQRMMAQQERRQVRAQNAERPQRAERLQQRVERPQRAERVQQRAERPVRQAQRVERQQVRENRAVQQRLADRRDIRQNRIEAARERVADRRDLRVDNVRARIADRQDARTARFENRIDPRINERIAARTDRFAQRNAALARRQDAFRDSAVSFAPVFARGGRTKALIDGCPPGLWMRNNGCMAPGQAAKLLGAPLATVSSVAALSALPPTIQYLYPDTDDYYWRYGNGYMYQVDRGDNLIAALFPLIAGGFIPGQYLPATYMNSYVPSYYGFNSFYQDSPYTCNRYADGVIYQVDCATGFIEDVIPLYASGYGVGQLLPSAYSTYNVPYQYRDLYYNTSDYGYWYGPGAIYQYDPGTSLITSVAALLSPGLTIGQPLPMGYNAYNVPYDYRATYYDTPDAWYRYNNGYIYRVDPTTQLVTAIVASILT